MKQTLTRLLAILLLLSCFMTMTACDEAAESKSETVSGQETEPVSQEESSKQPAEELPPEGYTLYKKDAISFVYPEEWVLTDGECPMMTGPSGNNINLVSESATKENTQAYKSLSRQNFMEYIGNALVAAGMTVSNVKVEHNTNDHGTEIIVCTYDATYMGKQMSFYQYIILGDKIHYTVTATEVASMAEVVEELYKSIRVE